MQGLTLDEIATPASDLALEFATLLGPGANLLLRGVTATVIVWTEIVSGTAAETLTVTTEETKMIVVTEMTTCVAIGTMIAMSTDVDSETVTVTATPTKIPGVGGTTVVEMNGWLPDGRDVTVNRTGPGTVLRIATGKDPLQATIGTHGIVAVQDAKDVPAEEMTTPRTVMIAGSGTRNVKRNLRGWITIQLLLVVVSLAPRALTASLIAFRLGRGA